MGRPATTTTGRLSLDIDPALKRTAAMHALRMGTSLTILVERGLKLAMAEDRARKDGE